VDRLDFALPDFTRVSWVSDRARRTWQPRIRAIGAAWDEIEWRSILQRVRDCCITVVRPEEYVERAGQWARLGLASLPIEIQRLSNYAYSATNAPAAYGQPFGFRLVLGSLANLARFKEAYDDCDNETIGSYLGYPACCTRFFEAVWTEQRMVDTTWPMAAATTPAANGADTLEVSGPIEANILWRWMGVRAVPHLPCSFRCAASVELGEKLIRVGREAGFDRQMQWLCEILGWPAEWSALHGIAEIKTPLLKVSTRTDATPRKYTVRRIGQAYPEEGARGLGFPYRRQAEVARTGPPGSRHDPDRSTVESSAGHPAWYAADNGFASSAAMQAAHRPIVELAIQVLAGEEGNLLDLGCGNGALLKTICEAGDRITPFGVDLSAECIAHARELLPEMAGHFKTGDLFGCDALFADDWRCALVLLMPGRMVEAPPARAKRLRQWLARHADRILVYAYEDWLTRYGSLSALVREAGLTGVSANSPSAGLAVVGPDGLR